MSKLSMQAYKSLIDKDLQVKNSPKMKDNNGLYNGTCNLSSCTSESPATWYNHGTYAYYCKGCAKRLSVDEFNKRDAERLYGHDLCTEGGKHKSMEFMSESGNVATVFGSENMSDETKNALSKLIDEAFNHLTQ